MVADLPPGLLRIDVIGPIVRVWYARSARDIAETHAILAAIDEALASRSFELLLLDSRDADRTPPEIQREIWRWLSGHAQIRKVATLMHSAALARSVRAQGAGQGVLIRSFHDEAAAREWLHAR